MKKIVSFENVSKWFKDKKAVDNVSFCIEEGESVAILGPNGAGKTTTMVMMLGLLKTTTGSIQLFDGQLNNQQIKNRIGVMLQEVSVIDALKVHELIKLFRSYYSNPLSYEDLVHYTGLNEDQLNKMAHKLSGGQKRRLNFALALVGNPDILFLDEPTVGMDVTSRKKFWEKIHQLKEEGKTIIFTTHYLQEAEDVADRIIMFSNGTIIADGSPHAIKKELTHQSVSFQTNDTIDLEELRSIASILDIHQKNDRTYLLTDDTDQLLHLLIQRNIPLSGIEIEHGKLEEAFEQLTIQKEDLKNENVHHTM